MGWPLEASNVTQEFGLVWDCIFAENLVRVQRVDFSISLCWHFFPLIDVVERWGFTSYGLLCIYL